MKTLERGDVGSGARRRREALVELQLDVRTHAVDDTAPDRPHDERWAV